jgi:hypothetical protein
MASVRGGLNVFGVLGATPALDWPQPYLLTGAGRRAEPMSDPLPLGDLVQRSLRALRCAAIGRVWPSTGCCAGTLTRRTLRCKQFHATTFSAATRLRPS